MFPCEVYNGCRFDRIKRFLNCQRLKSYKELMNHANAKETSTLLIERSNLPSIPYNTFSRYTLLVTIKIIGNKIGIIEDPQCKSAGRNCSTVTFLDNEVDYFGTCGLAILCNCRYLTLKWKYGVKTNVSRDYLKACPSVHYFIEENSPMSHLASDIFQGIRDNATSGLDRYIVSKSTFSLGKSFLGTRKYLVKLEVKFCTVTFIHQDAFLGLEKLTILSFSHTKFLDTFQLCPTVPTIAHLYLDKIGMKTLNSSAFRCFTGLREFFVHNNNLDSIDLSKLTITSDFYTIGLHNCSLKEIPRLCDILKPMRTLYLQNNLIQAINASDFYCLTELNLLSLSGNPLKTIDVNTFWENKKISTLSLNRVGTGELVIKIDTLKGLMKATDLKEINVNCSTCQMSWIAKMHFAYDQLQGYERLKDHFEVINTMKCQGTLAMKRYSAYHECAHGKVIKFGLWGKCSNRCGTGESVRINTCSKEKQGGLRCEDLGLKRQTKGCLGANCSGDGGWSAWSLWTSCTKVCGRGYHFRFRNCTNPVPDPNANPCLNATQESRECNQRGCPVNGNWENWGRWTQCSKSCNKGSQHRNRTCTNPKPENGGFYCKDNKTQKRSCNRMQCPVDGGFSKWQAWSLCTKSCSQGMRFRKRICDNPRPVGRGKECIGENLEVGNCTVAECDVDVFWTIWSSWTQCTKSCRGGHKIRYRNCSSTAHVSHNVSCKGTNLQRMACHNQSCPVDGGWSSWTLFNCSSKCGIGIKRLERECRNPTPTNGGKNCTGEKVKMMKCNYKFCKVKDVWSTWTVWSKCSATCSSGKQVQNRVCYSLYPNLKMKKTCLGPKVQERVCNSQPCSVYKWNGSWLSWTSWTVCPGIMKDGKQRRSRKCIGLKKLPSVAFCPGEKEQIRECILKSQPHPDINKQYVWTPWSICTKRCGNGTSLRKLACMKLSKNKGKRCVDNTTENKMCNPFTCAVHGKWSKWSLWSQCSTTCGEGRTLRIRNCTDPVPIGNGAYCTGHPTEYKLCNNKMCQDTAVWSQWGAWTQCGVGCAYGTQYRRRACTNFSSQVHSTNACSGKSMDTKQCYGKGCDSEREWTAWGNFSSCDKTCNGGVKKRGRKCVLKKNQTVTHSCKGPTNEIMWCNILFCPVPQTWLHWYPWSPCSKTCGNGTKSRHRDCHLGLYTVAPNTCHGQRLQNITCFYFPFCFDVFADVAWEKVWITSQKNNAAELNFLEGMMWKTAFGICLAWFTLYMAIGITRYPWFGLPQYLENENCCEDFIVGHNGNLEEHLAEIPTYSSGSSEEILEDSAPYGTDYFEYNTEFPDEDDLVKIGVFTPSYEQATQEMEADGRESITVRVSDISRNVRSDGPSNVYYQEIFPKK